ncbi:MAG TPA: CBS domain-containing protein [Vicinamibacteria bacterium]|jgi:CBS domain-containing protein
MRVENIMKAPQGCRENDQACDCAKLMKEQNIGFVPICDEAGKPVGAITDRDLAIRLVAEKRPAETRVSEVMTRQIVTCTVGDDLKKAEQLMRDNHKARMMVCDEDGVLVGVISLSDIVDFEDESAATQTFRDVAARETMQPGAS